MAELPSWHILMQYKYTQLLESQKGAVVLGKGHTHRHKLCLPGLWVSKKRNR